MVVVLGTTQVETPSRYDPRTYEPSLILLLLVLIPLVIASEQEKHARGVERKRVSCDPWSLSRILISEPTIPY